MADSRTWRNLLQAAVFVILHSVKERWLDDDDDDDDDDYYYYYYYKYYCDYYCCYCC